MLGDPEPISEPDPPAEDWMWPLATDGRTRLRRLGPDGRYTLRGTFGDGGQAYIWYAPDAVNGGPVAIKTSRPDGTLGRGQVAARRLTREARIMQSIPAHPNVMPLLDCGPPHLVRPESYDLRPRPDDPFEARDPWLVMPLTPHHRLDDLIAAGPLTHEEWLRIARGYAAGLVHLHRAGIVHRDLSPGNVLLTTTGPLITDFGVSWAPRWVDQGVEQTMSTGLTRQAAGRTEDWHAPEVIDAPLDERPDRHPASDIFSWGLFVATAAGRRHPWSKTVGNVGLDKFERDRMSRGDPAYDLAGPLADAGGWASLVRAALAPDPVDRPNAADLLGVLDDELAGRGSAPVRPTSPPSRRRTAVRDDDPVAAVAVLHDALRERWRSDPVWNRVGSGGRLPIAWRFDGPDDDPPDDPDAAARLIRIWRQGGESARTVVLGAAGSGKSELLVGVFRTLLTGWTKGEPLPLLVPLASWDPALTDLRTWLIEWLHVNHRFLDRPARGPVPKTQAARLLDDRHFALILDGLDEVLDKAPPRVVVEQLNNLDGPARILVSCRAGNRAVDGLFPAGATITLSSQDLGDVLRYLRRDEPDEQRWDPVVASLPHRPDLTGVLRTPLMVMLVDAIYNRRPAWAGDPEDEHRPHPRELLDLRGTEAITEHLLRGFVPARYAEEPVEYPAPDAGRWLGYLARMTAGTGELRWWELRVTSAPSSRLLLHSVTLAAVIVWTALSAGVMNAWIFGSATTGVTDAIRITSAALVCYGALVRVTGSYPAAVLAVLGAYITGTLSGSYDLAIASGLAAGFAWRPLRIPRRGGDLTSAVQVGAAAAAVVAAIRVLSLVVPLDDALVVGFAAGTFDGFALRWDEDVNGWLATGLVAGLLTWAGIQVTRGGVAAAAARWWARPEVHGLLAAVAVGAINSWADGARLEVDQPWLIAPADGLAAGLAVWWVSYWARRPAYGRVTRLLAPVLLGALTVGLNVLGYTQRADISAGVARAAGEGAAVAVLLWAALRDRPASPSRRARPALVAGAAGLLVGVLQAQSAGPVRGAAAGLAVTLAVFFFLVRGSVRSGPDRIDPIEAGIVGLTVMGLLTGFAYALLFGLVTGLAARVATDISQRKLPSLRMSAGWRQIAGGALLGVMAAVTAAQNGFPVVWLAVIGVTGGVAGAYTFGIRGDDPSNRLAASPNRLFRQDRDVFLRMTAVIAVAIGVAVGFRTAAGGQSVAVALAGAASALATYGLTAGLVVATSSTRFGVFAVRSAWLAARDELPWRLMRFLDDAHARTQVLRAAGSAYQFRHELLREQIASRRP
jgi:serine/threonine protein kinase